MKTCLSNLLTWNIINRDVITKLILWQNAWILIARGNCVWIRNFSITIKRSNLLNSNIIYRLWCLNDTVIMIGIQWSKILSIIRRTEARTSQFLRAFQCIFQERCFCYGQVHSPRMLQNKLKFNSSEHRLSFTESCKLTTLWERNASCYAAICIIGTRLFFTMWLLALKIKSL